MRRIQVTEQLWDVNDLASFCCEKQNAASNQVFHAVRGYFFLAMYIWCVTYIVVMSNKLESPSDVQRWLQAKAANLWPAALGSLSLRRTRCIRKNCRACQSGEKHPSWVLSGHIQGKRFSLYVPEALVPEVQHCLDNGRALQELLFASAVRYVKALKHAPTSSNP